MCYNVIESQRKSKLKKGGGLVALSDKIESFIIELLRAEEEEWLEIGRNELAKIFNCVPSQINYVISTRFNSNNGYIVESRRGGGGSVRIKRITEEGNSIYINAINSVGNSVDYKTSGIIIDYLLQTSSITNEEYKIMMSAICDKAITIPQPAKNVLRANILKNMIASKLY